MSFSARLLTYQARVNIGPAPAEGPSSHRDFLKQHQQSPIMMLLLITKCCQQHQTLQSMSQEL